MSVVSDAAYVRTLADLLGLKDWRIVVMDAPPDDPDQLAAVSVVRGRKIARMYLCPDWATRSAEERRLGVAHELVHCHIEPILVVVESARSAMPEWVFDMHYRDVDMASEQAVDGIATAIAPQLPLPEE